MNITKLLVACCVAIGISIGVQAQQASVVGQGHYSDSDFGKFYVRVGANFMNGDLIPLLNGDDMDGMYSASTGVNLEIGRYFFLHAEPIADLFKVGLDASFLSLGYNPIKWNDPDDPGYSETMDLSTVSVKLGPVISFNPVSDLYADAFVKLAPTVLTSISDMVDMGETPFALKSDVGVNLRYKKVTVTAGYESGSFEYDVETGERMPMGMFQLKLGLQFY